MVIGLKRIYVTPVAKEQEMQMNTHREQDTAAAVLVNLKKKKMIPFEIMFSVTYE